MNLTGSRSDEASCETLIQYGAVYRRSLALHYSFYAEQMARSEVARPMSTTVTESHSSITPNPKPSQVHTASSSLLLVAFAAVYLIWGSTYLAIRVGVESFPPLLLAGSRHLIFGLLFYPFLRWKTGIRPTWAHWRTAIYTGFLLLFVGNGGVCVAEQTVPSGVAALLVATVSLWMVLVDWLRACCLVCCWASQAWRC
jgi:EamA-like transporter family protein